MMNPEEQLKIIARNTVDLVTEEELLAKLREGRPLRVKYGADPSAPDLHLGHSVTLRAMRDLQDLGHRIIFIIGDFTGMLGDPSGKSQTRPQLTREQVEANAQTYARQVSKILDMERAELRYNSEWLGKLNAHDVIRLAARATVAQMLARDDFGQRYRDNQPLGVHELLYPIFQGYDSVAVEADIELGGTDQIFNFLFARELQRDMGQPPQIPITRPLIPGLDGTQKMSKSLGNYVGLTDPPDEMYGKLMSIPDRVMEQYFRLCTDVPEAEIEEMGREMASGGLNPRDAKMRLATEIVTAYHSGEAAREAEKRFVSVFASDGVRVSESVYVTVSEDAILDAVLENATVWVAKALVLTGLAPSASEARRLVKQGAVWVEDARMSDPEAEITLTAGLRLRVGKRRGRVLRFGEVSRE